MKNMILTTIVILSGVAAQAGEQLLCYVQKESAKHEWTVEVAKKMVPVVSGDSTQNVIHQDGNQTYFASLSKERTLSIFVYDPSTLEFAAMGFASNFTPTANQNGPVLAVLHTQKQELVSCTLIKL